MCDLPGLVPGVAECGPVTAGEGVELAKVDRGGGGNEGGESDSGGAHCERNGTE